MNKQRRNELAKIATEMYNWGNKEGETYTPKMLAEAMDKWADRVEAMKDEEQEAFDNLPESLQSDEKQEVIDELEIQLDFLRQTEEDIDNGDDFSDWIDALHGCADELTAL